MIGLILVDTPRVVIDGPCDSLVITGCPDEGRSITSADGATKHPVDGRVYLEGQPCPFTEVPETPLRQTVIPYNAGPLVLLLATRGGRLFHLNGRWECYLYRINLHAFLNRWSLKLLRGYGSERFDNVLECELPAHKPQPRSAIGLTMWDRLKSDE